MSKYRTGERQRQAIEFIRSFRLEHGYPPTVREIMSGIGMKSPGATHSIIKSLHHNGAIAWCPNRQRSIELVPASPVLTVELPPHLYAQVQDIARKAKVTPEAVVIEAVRDGFRALRSKHVPHGDTRETVIASPEVRGSGPEAGGTGCFRAAVPQQPKSGTAAAVECVRENEGNHERHGNSQ